MAIVSNSCKNMSAPLYDLRCVLAFKSEKGLLATPKSQQLTNVGSTSQRLKDSDVYLSLVWDCKLDYYIKLIFDQLMHVIGGVDFLCHMNYEALD